MYTRFPEDEIQSRIVYLPVHQVFLYIMNPPSPMTNIVLNNQRNRRQFATVVESGVNVFGPGMDQLD